MARCVRLFRCGVSAVFLLCLCISTAASASDKIMVRKSSEPFDAFKVRDQLLKDHEWQETLRMQQQIKILQSLPMGCVFQLAPYRHYLCHGKTYRPYQYQGKQIYIEIEMQ